MFHRYNENLKQFTRENRKAGNLAEVLLWKHLRARQLGHQFNRQKPIGDYIVDFLCKDLSLIVEIDGHSHDGAVEYDADREAYLRSLGYSVLRFSHREVLSNSRSVAEAIHGWIVSNNSV